MPYKSRQSGTEANKGKPTQNEYSKASIIETDSNKLKEEENVRSKYADKEGEPDPDKVNIAHKNRNTNKPQIDKPAYGSSK